MESDMLRKTLFTVAFLLALLAVVPAFAQGTPVYRQETVIDFSDVALEGELRRPDGAYLLVRKRAEFASLIRLREHFLNELQTSVDNL
jgi:hypothetical protein